LLPERGGGRECLTPRGGERTSCSQRGGENVMLPEGRENVLLPEGEREKGRRRGNEDYWGEGVEQQLTLW